MNLKLMSKRDLIEDYKKKERELNVNKRELENALQKKEDALQKKDDDIRKKDDDIRKKDDDIRKKDIIIKDKEASMEQYKKTTSEREMNHFLNIIQDFQESEQTTLNRASSNIFNYVSFFSYCFNIELYRYTDPINKGKTLLWKFGDWVIEDHEGYVSTAVRFLCKLLVRYISSGDNVTRSSRATNYTREFLFEFKEIICSDWMHKLNPKIDESTNNSLLLNCLLRIHSSPHNVMKEAGNPCEAISSQIFFALFNELKLFLSVLNEMLELKIYQEKIISDGGLDGILYDRGKACMVVGMKKVQLFTGNFSNSILSDSLIEFILQLTNYMIKCGCSRGILSDSFNYILIEIDPSVKEHSKNNKMTLKYKYVNANSLQPSLLEVLLGFIQESIEDDESGKRMLELNGRYPERVRTPPSSSTKFKRKRTSSTENPESSGQESGEDSSSQQESSARPSTAESYQDLFMPMPDTGNTELTSVVEEPYIKIQYENLDTLLDYTRCDDGFTRVLKSKAKYFQNILEADIDPEETIIVKIYLDFHEYSEKEAEEAKESHEAYTRERECVMKISQDPEYHNCYLQHSEAYVEAELVNKSNRKFIGNVILSRYAGEPWDGRSSSRQEIEKQLEVIHRNRIVHCDIRHQNILYNEAEEKVYIMDFSLSWIYDPETRNIDMYLQEDWRRLRYLCENLD